MNEEIVDHSEFFEIPYDYGRTIEPLSLPVIQRYFILTGSRYFQRMYPYHIQVGKYSDWDFLTYHDHIYLDLFLDKFGSQLHRAHLDQYGGDTFCVYYANDERLNINIIVKKDKENYEKYIDLYHELSPAVYDKYFWKSSKKYPKNREQIRSNIDKLLSIS